MASLQKQQRQQASQPNESNINALLKECNEKIAQLETQLAKQRDIKATLEQTLTTLRTNTPTSMFNNFPEDILIEIFSEVILGNPLEMAIGPILLVCRRWNNIASNVPLLWTTIASNLRPDEERVNRATKYVEMAIRKSRSLPLNVTMRVLSPESLWQDIVEKLYPLSSENNNEVETNKRLISKRTDTIKWFDMVASTAFFEKKIDSSSHFPPCTGLSGAVNNHVDAFIGEELIPRSIDRIRSLTVYFNSHETSYWPGRAEALPLWRFNPELERLAIIDEVIGVKKPSSLIQPYLHPSRNLTHLSWGAASELESVIGEGKQLTHLRLYWHRGLGIACCWTSNLPKCSLTQNLRQLFLYCAGDTSRNIDEDRDNLTFPQLEDLALAGTINRNVLEAIKVPRLSTLRLVDYSSCNSVLTNLPKFASIASIEKLRVHMDTFTLVDYSSSNTLPTHLPPFPFPSINKLYMHVDIYSRGGCTIDKTLELFPSISELGIVGESIELVKDCIIKLRTGTISMKGYKYSEASYWLFDSYDNQEIVIDS